jgi:hypothetical protein
MKRVKAEMLHNVMRGWFSRFPTKSTVYNLPNNSIAFSRSLQKISDCVD